MTDNHLPPALLFDFDGVLADTEPLHFECWREVLRPKGITLEWDYYETKCIGISDREMLAALGRLSPTPYSIDELWPLYPLKKKAFADLVEHVNPVSEATIKVIKSLQDFKIGLVTSSGTSEISPILLKTGLFDRFHAMVFGDQVKALKPDPEPYRTAMERLGATRAIAFEDSRAGLESARRAGCEVIEVRSPADLPDLIRQTVHSLRLTAPDPA